MIASHLIGGGKQRLENMYERNARSETTDGNVIYVRRKIPKNKILIYRNEELLGPEAKLG